MGLVHVVLRFLLVVQDLVGLVHVVLWILLVVLDLVNLAFREVVGIAPVVFSKHILELLVLQVRSHFVDLLAVGPLKFHTTPEQSIHVRVVPRDLVLVVIDVNFELRKLEGGGQRGHQAAPPCRNFHSRF